MGLIAGAFATSHVLMSPEGIEAQARRVHEGMKEIGRRVRAARPDVLVIISSDHLMNFKLELQVPFIIGAADEYEPWGDMDIPKNRFSGHREFSEGLLAYAWDNGLDLAKAAELRPDHGVSIPNAIVNPEGRIPVVPLYINTAMTPVPSPRRGWALGALLRRYVADVRPADERVVVLGAGGLSHWICMDRQGEVNGAWDHRIMDTIVSGRGEDLAGLTPGEILEQGGNGGLEVINWICMAGAVPGARGECVYYEQVPEWLTGMGGIAMHVETPKAAAANAAGSGGQVRLCGAAELEEGQMLQARLAGHDPFLVCRQDGNYYVLEDGCTHALASLSEGWLDEGRVLCPLHGGAFDIRTGKAAALPCKTPVRTFTVEIRDGGIWIDPSQPKKR